MIRPISALSPKVFRGSVKEKHKKTDSQIMEERLAMVNATGTAVIAGALTTAVSRSYTASWKHAGIFGLGAAFITMLFVSPKFLYKNKIQNFVKEKDLDSLAREKDLPKKTINKMKRI